MIKLKKLALINFFSHQDTFINFNEYSKLVLIEGITSDGRYNSNGAGKSTILEGIIYALTGETLRGVSVNDVVNRFVKKDTRVRLEFQKDEDIYEVNRYRKDTEHGDSLLFFKNSEDISKRLNKDTQILINDVLGISYKVLISTIFLGEGLSSRFTQLSDAEKKSTIESTLNLEYNLSSSRDEANKKLTAARLEKSKLEGKLSTLKEMQSIDPVELKNKIHNAIELRETYATKLNSQKEIIRSSQEIKILNDNKLMLLKDSINKYESIEKELSSLDADTVNLVNKTTLFESAPSHICPLCHTILTEEDSVESVREDYKKQLTEKYDRMKLLVEQKQSLPDIKILKDKYVDIKSTSDELQVTINAAMTDITTNSRELGIIENDIKNSEQILKNVTETQDMSESIEFQIEFLDADIESYEYFYKLFSPTGILVNILEEAVDYINERLTIYSSILLDKCYKIQFNKGKISLVDEKGSTYQSLSNGEKRRLDISIQFSLHDYVHMYCGLKLNCCFIDEILDTLDSVGVENIFEVLRLKLDYCGLNSIYVITHNENLKDKFDRIITVSKNKDGNSIILR